MLEHRAVTYPAPQAFAMARAGELQAWEKNNDRAFVFLMAALVIESTAILLVGIVALRIMISL